MYKVELRYADLFRVRALVGYGHHRRGDLSYGRALWAVYHAFFHGPWRPPGMEISCSDLIDECGVEFVEALIVSIIEPIIPVSRQAILMPPVVDLHNKRIFTFL